ncbi:MAG: alpha/beta fold hydrolase [Deltaproteobacteria bacterium]|nr:alpha/beta fold hydrolase [Deltaproteobacteria bacterium]
MTSTQESDSETAVCGCIREPLAFWLWHRLAGAPDEKRLVGVTQVESIRFRTRDGNTLGGYKLVAANPKGCLLVAQGNAMLADHLVADLQRFRDLGFDVYVYDYRGYGLSEGKSRLAAIVTDYTEIVTDLQTRGYQRLHLYGISIGGVMLLNAVGQSTLYTRLVVDSSPSRISPLGCPERYDPVRSLPPDSSRLLIITGERDRVVTPRQMAELLAVAESRGASILRDPEFAHPYQDTSSATHRRRQTAIAEWLRKE